ncbi:hypothetical protein WICPIJ_006248 [Wickerhamomyces pijperi]|uniref:EF-hand domain-containing protein n=1 Tax=Wickerhamomyces pijperi TaxID=599730 RepID=A0A9P8TL59_WICPI|nr:hypothetical protein WICPIJ_006248 [Wickerhamomyces pijperi]
MAGDDLTHFPTPTEAFGIRQAPQRRAPGPSPQNSHNSQMYNGQSSTQPLQSPRYQQNQQNQQFINGQQRRSDPPLHPSQNAMLHRPSDSSMSSSGGRSTSGQYQQQAQPQFQGQRVPSGQNMNMSMNNNYNSQYQQQQQSQPQFNNMPPVQSARISAQSPQNNQFSSQSSIHSRTQPIPSPPKTSFPSQMPNPSPPTQQYFSQGPSLQQQQPAPQESQRTSSSTDPAVLLERQLRDLFHRLDRDRNGRLNETELQSALTNNDGAQFKSSTVLLMIKMFDRDFSGGIEFKEFFHLWNYITHWRKIFIRYDVDQNQKISFAEYQSALEGIGYRLPTDEALYIFQKFGEMAPTKVMYLNFDMFVESVVWLLRCTNVFKKFDSQGNGVATITFQDFVHEFISFVS